MHVCGQDMSRKRIEKVNQGHVEKKFEYNITCIFLKKVSILILSILHFSKESIYTDIVYTDKM